MSDLRYREKLSWWPSAQDYNESVQNPRTNFADAELQTGLIEEDKLGLPRPITGHFACVYRSSCQHRDLAVRCFLHKIDDQAKRYQLISDFVQNDDLPYTVTFQYLPDGIKINNTWFPALKMEWVEGDSLDRYIKDNLMNPAKLKLLEKNFYVMCQDLQHAGIAHCDLQHGNIIVSGNGTLTLVDYDGMYVPSMHGFLSHELGHPNYQHPGREAHHFGSYLDKFPAWVIYASIRAIRLDPSLYERLGGGDDCLLFKRADFITPFTSCAFAALEHHANDEIRRLGKMVRSLLTQPVDQMSPLTLEIPTLELDEISDSISSVRSNSHFSAMSMNGRPVDDGRAFIERAESAFGPSHLRALQQNATSKPAQQNANTPNPISFFFFISICGLLGAYCLNTGLGLYLTKEQSAPRPISSSLEQQIIPKKQGTGRIQAMPVVSANGAYVYQLEKNQTFCFLDGSTNGPRDIRFAASYSNQFNQIHMQENGGDESLIKDLGAVDFQTAPIPWDLQDHDRQEWQAEAIAGHVYALHIMHDLEADFWVKMQILELKDGERMTFRWEMLNNAPFPSETGYPMRFDRFDGRGNHHNQYLTDGTVRMQLLNCAGGGNPSQVCMTGAPNYRVDRVSPTPLEMAYSNAYDREAVVYVKGGFIPPGKVWIVRKFKYFCSGNAEMLFCVGNIPLLYMSQVKQPLSGTREGRIVIHSGEEGTVFGQIERGFGKIDVTIEGEITNE